MKYYFTLTLISPTRQVAPHLGHHSYICAKVPSAVLQHETCYKGVSIITAVSHLPAYYLQDPLQADCRNIHTEDDMEDDGRGEEEMVASFLIGAHTVYIYTHTLCVETDRETLNVYIHTVTHTFAIQITPHGYNLIILDILALHQSFMQASSIFFQRQSNKY